MKRLLPIVLILTMVVSFCACSQTGSTEKSASNAEVTIGQFPVTVTAHADHKVTIEREPQRIVSCYYITSSLLKEDA